MEDDLALDFYESEAGKTKKRKASGAASSTVNAERKKRIASATEPALANLGENAGINIPRRYSILPLIDDKLLQYWHPIDCACLLLTGKG